jgi:dTDP-4-amino-4,6-dideoxygalactose transaminase
MNPWQYDLTALAKHRCRNAQLIQELIQPLRGRVDPLWQLSQGVVPQTYPVLVHTPSRDLVYERMNAAGFGVVSLYHTLIDEISREDFPDSFELSRTIMNLPVHQEATEVSLTAMIEELAKITA